MAIRVNIVSVLNFGIITLPITPPGLLPPLRPQLHPEVCAHLGAIQASQGEALLGGHLLAMLRNDGNTAHEREDTNGPSSVSFAALPAVLGLQPGPKRLKRKRPLEKYEIRPHP